MEPISEFYLVLDSQGQIIATHSRPGPQGEDYELMKECEILYDQIGVEGYQNYCDFTMWFLNGAWYTDNQINRMLRLKAFA